TPVTTIKQEQTCSICLLFGSHGRWVRQQRGSRPCHRWLDRRGIRPLRPARGRPLADLTRRVPAPELRPPPHQSPAGRPPPLAPSPDFRALKCTWCTSTHKNRRGGPGQMLGSEPTTLTKLTHSPGEPPRLWVRASFLPAAIEEIV